MSVIYYVVNEVEPSHVHFVDNSITFKTKNVKIQGVLCWLSLWYTYC